MVIVGILGYVELALRLLRFVLALQFDHDHSNPETPN
jgi:hypothetical protein